MKTLTSCLRFIFMNTFLARVGFSDFLGCFSLRGIFLFFACSCFLRVSRGYFVELEVYCLLDVYVTLFGDLVYRWSFGVECFEVWS